MSIQLTVDVNTAIHFLDELQSHSESDVNSWCVRDKIEEKKRKRKCDSKKLTNVYVTQICTDECVLKTEEKKTPQSGDELLLWINSQKDYAH